jgi:hypothetical protein
MTENPGNDEDFEYRDYLGEAMADHAAGPVKKSKFMVGVLTFSLVYLLTLFAAIVWRFVAAADLTYSYFTLVTMLLTPIVGTAVFIVGFLRRYRYTLGKTVERAGLVIFGLGWVLFFLLMFLNPVTR